MAEAMPLLENVRHIYLEVAVSYGQPGKIETRNIFEISLAPDLAQTLQKFLRNEALPKSLKKIREIYRMGKSQIPAFRTFT